MKKIKTFKTVNKNVDVKYTQLFKPNDKILEYNYCLSVHDNVLQLRLFVREYPIAAMLNPSLKSRFISEFIRFSRIKKIGH